VAQPGVEAVPQRQPTEPQDDIGVSTVELFFDLVFVFTITQLTSLLVAQPTWVGVARVALVFGNVWWMYGGYAWLTNAVPPREPVLRLLILVGMAGFLVVALSIPEAFGDSGVAFGLGYLVVTLVHTGMFLRSSQESAVRAMARLGPFNGITAMLLLAAGFTGGAVRWALWAATFVLHWATPVFTAVGGFGLRSAHFVERHGLIVLIALGESIVAVGIGVAGRHLDAGLILIAVLGLALAATLWWLYFDGEDERAERAMRAATGDRGSWLGLFAFGYAFLPLLGGIIVLAAGVKGATAHHGEHATAASAWFLAAGVAVYVAGLALFRRVLACGPVRVRLAIAALALPTAFLGLTVSPEVQMAALAAIVAAGVIAESRWLARRAQPVAE
jgi:low temperature requirement protein LtrA